ncbi:hypothetical protein HK100_011096 [Physocladia obscura]|uniref:RRM domain-containing protein n=1 Tax=Physocladia obscura TaxID=109957 RepID=A0AAD5T2C5_9FUNG|nr:hypothetical protein HK100_011096 [Physocladia obscura]
MFFAGKLPRDVSEREIKKHFETYGHLREIRILVGFAFVEYDDHRDARDAVEKLDGTRFLGDRIIVEPAKTQRDDRDRDRGDRRGDRDSYRDRERVPRGTGNNRLKIENLPGRISWQGHSTFSATKRLYLYSPVLRLLYWGLLDRSLSLLFPLLCITLKDLMRKAGEVTFTDIDKDGYGIVEFSNAGDMDEAIKIFDDYEYEGRRLIATEVKSRGSSDDRKRRSRSRSRSPRRSSGHSRSHSSSRSRSHSPRPSSRRGRDTSEEHDDRDDKKNIDRGDEQPSRADFEEKEIDRRSDELDDNDR